MSKSNSMFVSVAALVLSLVALGLCLFGCKKGDTASVEEALKANPEMVVNAIKQYEQNMREQAMAEAKKLVQANIEEMNNDADTPFVGPKDAKVTVVEFFDYSCGYCHRLFPELKSVVDANADVKFVSLAAAKASVAAGKQGKFAEMHNALFGAKERLTKEKIRAIAEEQGLDMTKFDADVNSEEVSKMLGKVSTLANKIQVNGVPVLFVNGEMLQTLSGADIQARIDEAK